MSSRFRVFHIYMVYTYLLYIFVNSRKLTNRETCMENAYFNSDCIIQGQRHLVYQSMELAQFSRAKKAGTATRRELRLGDISWPLTNIRLQTLSLHL